MPDLFDEWKANQAVKEPDLFDQWLEQNKITTDIEPEETNFMNWYKNIAAELGINPDPDDPRHYYNYRGYWRKYGESKAGMEINPEDKRWHFPDEFKLKGHPTYPKEPEEEPTWWESAWEKTKGFGEWLFPKGIQDLPRQYGAALQKGGMAAGEAMTWLTRLLPGNEDRKPYAEQTTAEQAWTVAQAGATFAVTQELIREGVTLIKDLKLNLGTLFAKEQSKSIKQAIDEIYKSVVGRPLSDSPEAIARYRAILAYKKDLPSAEVTRLTTFINKTTTPVLPSPSLVTPTPTPTVAPAITQPPIIAPTGRALAIKTGDIVSDGLISGRVIGEVVLGKNIPAYKIEILSGREKGQISAIVKNQAQLEKPKEIAPKAEAITVYHGTTKEFAEIDFGERYGQGIFGKEPTKAKVIFFSEDIKQAQYFQSLRGEEGRIIEASINPDSNILDVTAVKTGGHDLITAIEEIAKVDKVIANEIDEGLEVQQALEDPAFGEKLKKAGYDGIRFIEPEGRGTTIGIFNKEVIQTKQQPRIAPKPEIAPKAEIEKVAPISKEPIELATAKQIRQAHVIARGKAMISEKGKMKPQYRSLAKMMVGKKSISEMTKDEATIFINALNKLPEPTKNAMGELVPPSITRITALVPKEFFERKFKEPTIAKYLTSQTYYAEKLGIKSLVEPSEIGKQEFDLEFRNVNKTVDQAIKKIDLIGKTTIGEKVTAKVKNIPTKAVVNMAELLNKYEEPPETLSQEEKDIFNWFRSLNREILKRENEVRKSLDFKPIEYKEAYLRHTADTMAKEMLRGEYPFPQGLKYWSEKIVGKKIFNPMEFQRKLSDDLIGLWTKDLAQATKSMLWSGLKEIHLAQPVKILSKYLNALSKDTKIYKDLTPEEKLAYQKSVIPASTKKWLINYENQVIKGQSSELDANVNRIVTESGLKGLFNKVLNPFGRTVGEKPITDSFQFAGRLTISGVMGWIPRQIIRNSFQSVQNLALYGVKATTKALLPVSTTNDKNLEELLTDSIFLKSYTGFEELPANLMGKLERIWLAPYGAVAVFNAKTAMKAAYWDTLDLIVKPKYKDLGWADPQRTKDTPKDYLYPSEKEKLLKEMEFGSGATQYQYIPIGMPELFRHKALIPLTRLQSWWMNYFAKFTREALHRAFKGETSYGTKLPWSRRVNYLKYLLIGGAVLTGMGYKRSFLIGVLPTYLSPAGQVALGLYSYATAKSDWQRQQALKKIQFSWTAFIPGSLAWRDFLAVWQGEKELKELFFYKQKEEEKKKKKYIRPY